MVPALSRTQLRTIDELATTRYGIPPLLLMENAGSNAARIICREYPSARHALIACGTGNNGGDGMVIARHLNNFGWKLQLVVVGNADRMTDSTRVQFEICTRMELPMATHSVGEQQAVSLRYLSSETVIIDALLGTGFRGVVRSPVCEFIKALNSSTRRALIAIDVPSGLDCDTGEASNAVIRADLTITFVARKRGFDQPGATVFTGRVEIADIGAPRELIETVAMGPAPN